MVEFKLFKVYLFMMLPFTAETQQNSKFNVTVGGEVILPCENRKDFHDNCYSTTWLFSYSANRAAETLFEREQIHKDAGSKSDRLSVTEDCSLVIKKVTAEDDGRYSCRQFRSGQQVTESLTELIVINTSKLPTTKSVAATTILSSTTKFLMIVSSDSPTETKVQNKFMLIILAAGGFVFFLIIMGIIRWRRINWNKTQRRDDTDNPADVTYSNIIHSKKTNKTAHTHDEHYKGDAMIYSTATLPFTGASTDNSIYANIENIYSVPE